MAPKSTITIKLSPHADLAMEILATLPKFPTGADVSDLRSDFGLRFNDQVVCEIEKLQRLGYAAVYHRSLKECWIKAEGWEAAQRAAEAYLDGV